MSLHLPPFSSFKLICAMGDDLENLRRVIRLMEETDAYFDKAESVPSAS